MIVHEGENIISYSQYYKKPRPQYGKLVPIALLDAGPGCNPVVLDVVAVPGVGSSWRGGSHPTNAVSSRVRGWRAGHLISGMAPNKAMLASMPNALPLLLVPGVVLPQLQLWLTPGEGKKQTGK